MRYELLDHTADILIKAHGPSLETCFANAAYAMFDQMVDLERVKSKGEVEVQIEGEDMEEMLYDMLSELLFIHEVDNVVLSEFEVTFTTNGLKCSARGEELDLNRHGPRAEIKAVTFHMMEVNEEEPSVTVLFDI
jgi:SHS2 domain-containing protein